MLGCATRRMNRIGPRHLFSVGAQIVPLGRYGTFQMADQMAEVAIARDLFADIVHRIDRP